MPTEENIENDPATPAKNGQFFPVFLSIIFLIIFFFTALLIGYNSSVIERLTNNSNKAKTNIQIPIKSYCESVDGVWLDEHKECEGGNLTKSVCGNLDGKYFECESACRHDPDVEVCINVCVKVCQFK